MRAAPGDASFPEPLAMAAVRVRFRNMFSWLGLGSSPERAQFAAAVERLLSERFEELNSAELHALTRIWSDLELYGRLARAADAGAVVARAELRPSGLESLEVFAEAVGISVCPCEPVAASARDVAEAVMVTWRDGAATS